MVRFKDATHPQTHTHTMFVSIHLEKENNKSVYIFCFVCSRMCAITHLNSFIFSFCRHSSILDLLSGERRRINLFSSLYFYVVCCAPHHLLNILQSVVAVIAKTGEGAHLLILCARALSTSFINNILVYVCCRHASQ